MPSHEPGMTTWCFLLAPPSQTRQRWRKPVGLSPSASFHNLRSLFHPDAPNRAGSSVALQSPARRPVCAQKDKALCRCCTRGGGARALPCPALLSPARAARQRGRTAAQPALSMCRPSRGSCTQNSPRGRQKTPQGTATKERGQPGSGEQALLLFIPRMRLFVQANRANLPEGDEPPGTSRRLQLPSPRHGWAFAENEEGNSEESKQDSFLN